MAHDNGGVVYPSEQGECQDGTWDQTYDPGMSLWDYFMGQAMQGMISGDGFYSRPDRKLDQGRHISEFRMNCECLALDAACMANAMITEKRKREGTDQTDPDVKPPDSVMSMTEQDDDARKDCGNCYFRDTSELDKPCNMCPQCGNEGKDRWTPRYDKPEA